MKKAIGFLILLSSLALLDGTPIHNHHGKYIVTRTRSSVQQYHLAGMSLATEDFIVDQDEDDEVSPETSAKEDLFQVIHNTKDTPCLISSPNDIFSSPLYLRVCDLRI